MNIFYQQSFLKQERNFSWNIFYQQSLLKPVEVYEFTIDLYPTSNIFLPGHRIRLDISSSNFPRFDRNPNTGNEFGKDCELKTANQTIYHDEIFASHLLLPLKKHDQSI